MTSSFRVLILSLAIALIAPAAVFSSHVGPDTLHPVHGAKQSNSAVPGALGAHANVEDHSLTHSTEAMKNTKSHSRQLGKIMKTITDTHPPIPANIPPINEEGQRNLKQIEDIMHENFRRNSENPSGEHEHSSDAPSSESVPAKPASNEKSYIDRAFGVLVDPQSKHYHSMVNSSTNSNALGVALMVLIPFFLLCICACAYTAFLYYLYGPSSFRTPRYKFRVGLNSVLTSSSPNTTLPPAQSSRDYIYASVPTDEKPSDAPKTASSKSVSFSSSSNSISGAPKPKSNIAPASAPKGPSQFLSKKVPSVAASSSDSSLPTSPIAISGQKIETRTTSVLSPTDGAEWESVDSKV